MAPDDSPALAPTPAPPALSITDSQIGRLCIGDVAGQNLTKITIIPIIVLATDHQHLADLLTRILPSISPPAP
jgi:hypothetical protein